MPRDPRDPIPDAPAPCGPHTAKEGIVPSAPIFDGLYLLKQRSPDKGVDHFGIGIGGALSWRLGLAPFKPAIVDLAPPAIRVTPWGHGSTWEVVERIVDEAGALNRLVA